MFESFLQDFQRKLNDYYSQQLSKSLLAPIIGRLFKDKRYKDVLIIASKFNDSQLAESDVMRIESPYAHKKILDFYEKRRRTLGHV